VPTTAAKERSRTLGDGGPMTDEQAKQLKSLSEQAFEPEAFNPKLSRDEAELRLAALSAKLRLLDEPPHTL
jgi:hypothetical protein